MSAFVVKPETMQRAVTAMSREIDSADDMDRLGRDFWRLNVQAVNIRYGETADEHEYDDWRWKVSRLIAVVLHDRARACRLLISLECLVYQLTEGDVPSHPLYVSAMKRIKDIQAMIVQSLPEYADIPWD